MKFPLIYRNKLSEIENNLGLTISQIGDVFLACHHQFPNDFHKYILIREEDDKGEYYLSFDYNEIIEYEPTEGLYRMMDGPAHLTNTEKIEKDGNLLYSEYKKIANKK
jgi:hypothetical protein